METKPIHYATLDPKDVERLPSHVKEPPGEYAADEWLLVRAPAGPMRKLIEKLNQLQGILPRGFADLSRDQYLDNALDWLLSAGSGPYAEMVVENLQMRREYVEETPMLTAAEIHRMSGLRSRNKSMPASRWKAEGKIFALRISGRDHYPAFQFDNGAPRPVIKDVLAVMPMEMTPWQTAFWFASSNGWLGVRIPQECLDDAEAVVEAASHLANPVIG